jgi:hypothetical protein
MSIQISYIQYQHNGIVARAKIEKAVTEGTQKTHADNSLTIEKFEFDKVMAAYQAISKKYKNALRELA